MFSVENFYYVLYTNLLKPANIAHVLFYPFGSTNPSTLYHNMYDSPYGVSTNMTWYYDQEPINNYTFYKCFNRYSDLSLAPKNKLRLLANSEHSLLKDELCLRHGYLDWYYFFHGFAALYWYNDCKYLNNFENQFTKVFISFNRLITKDRSYRMYFVSLLKNKNLLKYGNVSFITKDNGLGSWQDEINDPHSRLSEKAKKLITAELPDIDGGLIIDSNDPPGYASANLGYNEIKMFQSAFWHIVTETVFYDEKLHLTEKIFKPIISKRPFILIGAKGNLSYLKSYGFKTFDKWIDESYDDETDNDRRIEMVIEQMEKLCNLSQDQLVQMHKEMQEILEYNFNHFYSDFKKIIVKELLENFKGTINVWNNGRVDGRNVDISSIDFNQVEQIFLR